MIVIKKYAKLLELGDKRLQEYARFEPDFKKMEPSQIAEFLREDALRRNLCTPPNVEKMNAMQMDQQSIFYSKVYDELYMSNHPIVGATVDVTVSEAYPRTCFPQQAVKTVPPLGKCVLTQVHGIGPQYDVMFEGSEEPERFWLDGDTWKTTNSQRDVKIHFVIGDEMLPKE